MGVCASDANFYGSRGEVKGHEAPEPRATIREIRDRLEDVFEQMDVDKLGNLTHEQMMHFLKASKRNLHSISEIKAEVDKIFSMVDVDQEENITADEFIAVYSNMYYPQQLTMAQVNKSLRNRFGRMAVDELEPSVRQSRRGPPSPRNGFKTRSSMRRKPSNARHVSI